MVPHTMPKTTQMPHQGPPGRVIGETQESTGEEALGSRGRLRAERCSHRLRCVNGMGWGVHLGKQRWLEGRSVRRGEELRYSGALSLEGDTQLREEGTAERLTCRILQRSDRHSMSSHGWYMPRVTQFRRMTSILTHSNHVLGVKDKPVAARPRVLRS